MPLYSNHMQCLEYTLYIHAHHILNQKDSQHCKMQCENLMREQKIEILKRELIFSDYSI